MTADAAPALPAGIDALHAVFRYEGPVRGWVRRLKYDRRDGTARLLSTLMATAHGVPRLWHDADCVLAVPLHWRRLWQRGFNQSHFLAKRLGRLLERRWPDARPPRSIGEGLLVRHRHTAPQVRMSGGERHHNVAAAFSVPAGLAPLVAGQRVLLLDDVTTTGATLGACATALRAAGATQVTALLFAAALTTEREASETATPPGPHVAGGSS